MTESQPHMIPTIIQNLVILICFLNYFEISETVTKSLVKYLQMYTLHMQDHNFKLFLSLPAGLSASQM